MANASRGLWLVLLMGWLAACGPDSDSDSNPQSASPKTQAAKDASLDNNPALPQAKKPDPIELLQAHLAQPRSERPNFNEQDFVTLPLSIQQAGAARQLLWQDRAKQLRRERQAEMDARKLKHGNAEMPFFYKVFGEKPDDGRSLYISMHGGGGGPASMNNQQWENQKRLYAPKEGVYVAPRAPTNSWNLWHQAHVDPLFDRLIENMIVFEDVNPDKVYLMGYSAGGDGVYQLAPRMADRFAAAAMMAGHPNETSPLGLRNLPFTIHVGERDAGYKRNTVAAEWKKKLADLQKDDPQGYPHWVKIYPGKGHWLNREDAAAVPWMAEHTRDRFPKRIVWKQDDVTHTRFYWLAIDPDRRKARSEITASLEGQTIHLQSDDVPLITVRFNDQMIDLNQPIKIIANGEVVMENKLKRQIRHIAASLQERGDPKYVFSAQVIVTMPGVEKT